VQTRQSFSAGPAQAWQRVTGASEARVAVATASDQLLLFDDDVIDVDALGHAGPIVVLPEAGPVNRQEPWTAAGPEPADISNLARESPPHIPVGGSGDSCRVLEEIHGGKSKNIKVYETSSGESRARQYFGTTLWGMDISLWTTIRGALRQ